MFSYPARPARPHAAAFTLVELLAVIAIIGVLAGLVIMGMGKVRANARQSGCLSNLRQIGVGWQLYLGDNKGRFPEFATYQMYYWGGGAGSWGGPAPETRPLYPYIPDARFFRCPSDLEEGTRPPLYTLSGNSYVMSDSNQRGLLSRPEATNRVAISGYYRQLQHPARTIMVYEHTVRASEPGYISNPTASYYRDNWHTNDTGNLLMADGHVETFQRAALTGHMAPLNPVGYTWGWSRFSGPDW
jgi:prepilin-type N-terminal cleavage/methylation domain-containing protein/prepilin-type processing-associated H-X9-DG protein